jgi:hypothetical protein
MKNILIHEGNIKVRWLAYLAVRHKDVAEEHSLLPVDFPRLERLKDVADALGTTPSAFSNWFPDPTKPDRTKGAELVNRPPSDFARNVAKLFGFAPPSDDDHVWRDWWANCWPSFMPSENDDTNRNQKTSAEDFKKQYREALKNGSLKFPPSGVASATPTVEEGIGGVTLTPTPSARERAPMLITERAESPETSQPPKSPQQSRPRLPIILTSAVVFIACGYAVASLWKYVYYPTVDLVRTIDFSELACDAEGRKHDVAYIYDDYTVVRNLFRFDTYVKVADLRGDSFSVDVFDVNSDPARKIVAIQSDTNHERRLQSYALAVRDSHVRANWVWTKAHSQPSEGTAVTGGWNLRNLTVNYALPAGREVTKIDKIIPPGSDCRAGQNNIYCRSLYTRDEVQIWWDWNVWDGCKK